MTPIKPNTLLEWALLEWRLEWGLDQAKADKALILIVNFTKHR